MRHNKIIKHKDINFQLRSKAEVQAPPTLQAPKVGVLGDAGAIAEAELALQNTEELLFGYL